MRSRKNRGYVFVYALLRKIVAIGSVLCVLSETKTKVVATSTQTRATP